MRAPACKFARHLSGAPGQGMGEAAARGPDLTGRAAPFLIRQVGVDGPRGRVRRKRGCWGLAVCRRWFRAKPASPWLSAAPPWPASPDPYSPSPPPRRVSRSAHPNPAPERCGPDGARARGLATSRATGQATGPATGLGPLWGRRLDGVPRGTKEGNTFPLEYAPIRRQGRPTPRPWRACSRSACRSGR
jgi:hypothetical protein